MPPLRVPPRSLVAKPDEHDPIDYYYRPLTAPLYRARLRHALALLGAGRFGSLLEVGYGSGILFPELAARAERVVGVDVHAGRSQVAEMVERLGLAVELREGSVYELPFADGEFDAVVCLSVLEHLRDVGAALAEMARVTRIGGPIVIGVPVRNAATGAFFRLVGYDPLEIHPSSHRDVQRAIEGRPELELRRRSIFPRVLPANLAAYATFLAQRR